MSDSVKQILIIGLGLIGSSIAKASKNKGIIVHGFDINESSLSTALEVWTQTAERVGSCMRRNRTLAVKQ